MSKPSARALPPSWPTPWDMAPPVPIPREPRSRWGNPRGTFPCEPALLESGFEKEHGATQPPPTWQEEGIGFLRGLV